MKLTVLGSGTMMLKKDKFPSSFLLEEGDIKLLLDCGFGAIARLSEMDMDLRQINAVFISHFHASSTTPAFVTKKIVSLSGKSGLSINFATRESFFPRRKYIL